MHPVSNLFCFNPNYSGVLQFSCNTEYTELAPDTTGLRAQSPKRLPPLQTPVACEVPGHHTFDRLDTNPKDSFNCLRFCNSLEWLTELRTALYLNKFYYKGYKSDQPNEKTQSGRPGRVQKTELLFMEWGHLISQPCVHQTGTSTEL